MLPAGASLCSAASWGYLSSHPRVPPCIAHHPGRGIAASPGITARSTCGIVTGLAEAGSVAEQKDGALEATAEGRLTPGDRPPPEVGHLQSAA